MIPPIFRVVPVRRCAGCGQHMPDDHVCATPAVEALIRAAQDDYRRYGSQPDIDTP